jgi:energy-coupling factor transporter ATP-binding protein EcfA2
MTAPASRPVYAVACDRPIAPLASLETPCPEQAPDFAIRRRPLELPAQALGIFDGNARVGTRCCRVRSLTTSAGDLLRISGAGVFAIPRGEGAIDVDHEPGAAEDAVAEALLGPALAVAFARRGTFVLHAGAVVLRDHGAVGFLGESGAGKSTLARLLAAAGERVSLAADDLLAITVREEGAMALPHFPQLKLDAAAMAAIAGLAPRYPLRGLYVLAPAPAAAAAGATAALPAGDAAAHLLRHTIAGSLFAEDLLTAHLGFAAEVARRVPLHLLTVPRRMDVGAEVLELLLERGPRPQTGGETPREPARKLPADERDRPHLRAETLLRPAPGVLFTGLGEEAVLLDLKSGTYFGLNAVGSRIWQLIAGEAPLGTIRDTLLAEYDAQPGLIWHDIEVLVGELRRRGLLAESPLTPD